MYTTGLTINITLNQSNQFFKNINNKKVNVG